MTAKEIMAALMKMNDNPVFVNDGDMLYPMLEEELLKSEAFAKEFISSCNADEFEHLGGGFLVLTEAFGKPFLHWLLKHVEQKRTLTEYTEDMLREAVSIAYDVRTAELKDWMHPWLGKKAPDGPQCQTPFHKVRRKLQSQARKSVPIVKGHTEWP